MNNDVERFIQHFLDKKIIKGILFKEIHGLYFVFERRFTIIHNRVINAEIACVGIIYIEDDDYHYAALKRSPYKKIIKEFVNQILI